MGELNELISRYGYLAIAIGTFLEGEITILLAVAAAQAGLLALPGVLASAMAGTFIADQLFFHLGRRRGYRMLARHRHWRRAAARVRAISRRYHQGLILGFRFLYGLRTVTPFVLGMSRIPPIRFAVLDLIGTALWASAIVGLGLTFGLLAERYIAAFQHYQLVVIVALVIIAMLAAVSAYLYRRKGE